MTQWPMKLKKAPTPGAFLNKRTSSSLVERSVWLESSRPRKSPVARYLPLLEPPKPLPELGVGSSSSMPSMRSRELWEAKVRSRVPSTEKCSELSSGLTSGAASSNSKNWAMSSLFKSRSWFLVNVVGCQTGSSRLMPSNERNSKLWLSCSYCFAEACGYNIRSERMP